MSQAFIREGDAEWLEDVTPTLPALIRFLTRENNGIAVYEKRRLREGNRELYEMSNGLVYAKSASGKWEVVSSSNG